MARLGGCSIPWHGSLVYVIKVSAVGYSAARIWLGRKSAFGAMGQINDYMCLDGTIPVSSLPHVLKRIGEMSKEYGLDVGNVFHAGDGNMHPLILYDANKPGDLETCEAFGADILKLCVEVGGSLFVCPLKLVFVI